MTPKLVILDRDGVINEDSDEYIKSPEEWIPIEGSLAAIAALNRAGFTVAVASNQSGIARGYYDLATLAAIHEKMHAALAGEGGRIDYLVYCPHGPDDGCGCRKPKAGMLHQIGNYYQCSLQGVPVVGDSKRDLQAGWEVGAHGILVKTGKGERTLAAGGLPADLPVYDNLAAAVGGLLIH